MVGIAGLNPKTTELIKELRTIRNLGFKGIKIHPRFSKLCLDHDKSFLIRAINEAHQLGLVTYICTFLHTSIQDYPIKDPLYDLVNIIKRCPDAKIVLVHGGNINLMQYVELARFNENLLIDLSFTILKYEGSS